MRWWVGGSEGTRRIFRSMNRIEENAYLSIPQKSVHKKSNSESTTTVLNRNNNNNKNEIETNELCCAQRTGFFLSDISICAGKKLTENNL